MFSDVWICGILCSLLLSQMGASGSLSNIRCARSQRCRSAGSVVAVPAAAAVAPHTRQRTHTLGYLLDSFSQLSQFWFSDIRITNGGMCLMRKALLVKLAKNGLSPTWPDLAHWSMLMTMTMTMQFVVQLVEADVLLVCLVEDGRISNVARSNNHRKWLRHACRGISHLKHRQVPLPTKVGSGPWLHFRAGKLPWQP